MDNEYMARYMAERRENRRKLLIELLGGTCARCNETESLEFDHMIPGSQAFRISGKSLDKPWGQLLIEVAKCQLLCHPHHVQKSTECGETGGGWNKNEDPYEHGSMRCYQETKCKCSACRLAKHMYRNKEVSYTDVIKVS